MALTRKSSFQTTRQGIAQVNSLNKSTRLQATKGSLSTKKGLGQQKSKRLAKKVDTVWLTQRKAALERDEHRCVRCTSSFRLTVHHKLPRSSGGKHDLENLITLCMKCHTWVHSCPIQEAVDGGWLISPR